MEVKGVQTMPSNSTLLSWCGLLLAVVLCTNSRDAEAASQEPSSVEEKTVPAYTPRGEKAVAAVLERLRQTGSFNHPDYPWAFRARYVRGDTLYMVDFARRSNDGQGFVWVGKAVSAGLRYHQGELRLCLCDAVWEHSNGIQAWCRNREYGLPLPTSVPEHGFSPFAEVANQLPTDLQKALEKEVPFPPEQKKVVATFGEEYSVAFLYARNCFLSKTGRTVLAFVQVREWNECKKEETFEMLAVARFDRHGKVTSSFRGKDITVDKKEILELIEGDDSHTFTFRSADGKKFVLPPVKDDR
jgi:hypothetical protein